MKRLFRSGTTLLVGAGLGAAGSRLLSVRGGQEEDGGAGLLSRVPVLPVVPVVQASELTVSEQGRLRRAGHPEKDGVSVSEVSAGQDAVCTSQFFSLFISSIVTLCPRELNTPSGFGSVPRP